VSGDSRGSTAVRPTAAPREPLWHRGGLRVARIAGIPILLSPTWLISILIIVVFAAPVVTQVVPGVTGAASLAVALALALLLALSVLAHELGHCLAARMYGIPVLRVRLYLLGGVSELGRSPAGPGQDAVVAGAGPAVSALLAVGAGLLVGSFDTRTVGWLISLQIALANAIVAVFNLLPALPMDGGHVLRALVWRVTGKRAVGTTAATIGGGLVAIALACWAVWFLTRSGAAALLQALIAGATAVFVAAGAWAEQKGDGPAWPDDVPIRSLGQPLVQLPAESSIALVVPAAAGRPVLLTAQDGTAVGLLDADAAIGQALRDPRASASSVAVPLDQDQLIGAADSAEQIVDRVRGRPAGRFVLLDPQGRPTGVLLGPDVLRVLMREQNRV
jgi:Zn-dependent protease